MNKTRIGILTLAVLAIVTLGARNSSAQTTPVRDTGKTGYVPNANQAGANQINVTDPFEFSSSQSEIICAGFYVFDQNEQLQECCGCPISEDGLLTMVVDSGHPGTGNPSNTFTATNSDLVDNTAFLSASPLGFANVKIISFERNPDNTRLHGADPNLCDATAGVWPQGQNPFPVFAGRGTFVPLSLTPSLRAWGTHFQNQTNITESEYRDFPLSQNDANNYSNWCAALQQAASGRGVCSCGNDQGT